VRQRNLGLTPTFQTPGAAKHKPSPTPPNFPLSVRQAQRGEVVFSIWQVRPQKLPRAEAGARKDGGASGSAAVPPPPGGERRWRAGGGRERKGKDGGEEEEEEELELKDVEASEGDLVKIADSSL
jgi:hypothetical protein